MAGTPDLVDVLQEQLSQMTPAQLSRFRLLLAEGLVEIITETARQAKENEDDRRPARRKRRSERAPAGR